MSHRWSNSIALSAAFTLVMTVPNLSPFIILAMMADLGLDGSQAGLVLTLEIAILAMTPILLAPISPRLGLRQTLLTGAIICLAGNIASIFVEGTIAFTAVRMATGFGVGLIFLGVNRAISVVSDPVKLFGIVNTAGLIIAFVLFFFLPGIVDNYGLIGTYILLSLLALVSVPLVLLVTQIDGTESGVSKLPPIDLSGIKITMLLIALVSITAAYMAVYVFAEPIGVSSGFTRSEMGVMLAAVQIASIAGTSTATWMGLRFGSFMPMSISLIGVAIMAALCTFVQSTVVFTGAFFLLNFFFLFALPYQLGIGAQIDHTGRLAAIGSGTLYLGIAFSPFLGGYLITHHGHASLGLINCIAVAVGLILYWKVTTTIRNRRSNSQNLA